MRDVLTVCIPTYNRATIVFDCVQRLLGCANRALKLSVLVHDDHSTDETERLLGTIKDQRFIYIRNPVNFGAAFNTHLCFLHAPGRFAYLTSDEDDVLTERLPEMLSLFEESPDTAVALFGGDLKYSKKRFEDADIKEPFDALMRYGYSTRYMTGIVFNSDFYRTHIGEIKLEDSPDVWDSYSFMYSMAQLMCYGTTLTRSGVWYRQNRFADTQETNNARKDGVCYYEPKGRVNQMTTWMKAAAALPLPNEQRQLLCVKIIFDGMELINAMFDPDYAKLVRLTASDAQYDAYCEKMAGQERDHLCYVAQSTGLRLFETLFDCTPPLGQFDSVASYWLKRDGEYQGSLQKSKPVFVPVE